MANMLFPRDPSYELNCSFLLLQIVTLYLFSVMANCCANYFGIVSLPVVLLFVACANCCLLFVSQLFCAVCLCLATQRLCVLHDTCSEGGDFMCIYLFDSCDSICSCCVAIVADIVAIVADICVGIQLLHSNICVYTLR